MKQKQSITGISIDCSVFNDNRGVGGIQSVWIIIPSVGPPGIWTLKPSTGNDSSDGIWCIIDKRLSCGPIESNGLSSSTCFFFIAGSSSASWNSRSKIKIKKKIKISIYRVVRHHDGLDQQ